MGARQNVLIVSSDHTFASLLERELGTPFEVHSASTDLAAFALLDSYSYACVVIDLSAQSVAGTATISRLQLNALTVPVVALVPSKAGIEIPERAIVCAPGHDPVASVTAAVREAVLRR
jgi:DNA-binding response OmpR family regulator